MSAAQELASAGLDVLVADENQRPGGQIWRQRFLDPAPDESNGSGDAVGTPMAAHLTFVPRAVCHGVVGSGEVMLSTPRGPVRAAGRALVLATGGLERVLPLPGWTTPGVMTAGAAQTFLKGSGFFPYRRVVVAGTGPLLLASAAQLVDAGIEVAAVVEARRLRSLHPGQGMRLLAAPQVLAEGAGYLRTLRRARVPLRTGTGVSRVEGDDRVTGVRLKALRADWSFGDGPEEPLACDAVLLSHGFSSSTELASQAGAQIVWDDRRQTWRPQRDGDFRTTAEDVVAVGDCAGVAGVHVAQLEGQIAGIALAARLMGRPQPARVRGLRRRLGRLETFRGGMDELFRPGPGTVTWADAKTCVCRCQETCMADVSLALEQGVTDLHGVKLWTRAGMGPCQGRVCTPVLMQALTARGNEPRRMKPPVARFPVRPLPVSAFATPTSSTTQED
jgi:NADPH-dependent 2,4-dienoyl-CoA reductase/sulfur reductase-like enzyme